MVTLYLSVQAQFLAFTFLIVYVGAIAILFLFVVMLLNVKELTGVAGKGRASMFFIMFPFLVKLGIDVNTVPVLIPVHTSCEQFIYYVVAGYQDINPLIALYEEHVALFLLIVMILIAAMLGAIVLATGGAAIVYTAPAYYPAIGLLSLFVI